jgi:hypothetical protein
VTAPSDRIDDLSVSERWMSDARGVLNVPGGMAQRIVDMTRARAALEELRKAGLAASFTHVIVRAAALALSRNPRIYQMVCGYQRLTAGRVDIGLSMSGVETDIPTVLEGVDRKSLGALVAAIDDAIAATRAREERLRRTAWWFPFGFLRRWLLRRWYGNLSSRRRLAGMFEVSCDSNADVVVPLRFYTDAILSAGRVKDVVLAVDGEPTIRPMAWLTLCLDHVAMDGMRGAALMNAVKEILEGDELYEEALEAAAAERARA